MNSMKIGTLALLAGGLLLPACGSASSSAQLQEAQARPAPRPEPLPPLEPKPKPTPGPKDTGDPPPESPPKLK